MKTYDPTKSIRQMFFMPNVVPLYGVFIIILFVFMALTPMNGYYSARIVLPEAQFVRTEPSELLSIFINGDGNVWLEDLLLEDISTIHSRIKEDGNYKYLHKVLLKADCMAEFGRIQEVLKEIKKAEVDTVGLIVEHMGG